MSFPKFGLKEVELGSGDVIGRENIETFLTLVSKLHAHEKRSIVELTDNYDSAIACLVARLEKRFVNLNPIIQHMFLKLESMKKGEERDFVLNTLLHEFDDIVKEAREIFTRYGRLGSYPNINYSLDVREEKTRKGASKTEKEKSGNIAIPFKLLGMFEALEDNYGWIVPQNLFDESSQPKKKEKGDSQPYIGNVQFLCEKFASMALGKSDASSLGNT